jgi:hypothetical protein
MTFFLVLSELYRIFKEIWCPDAQKRRIKADSIHYYTDQIEPPTGSQQRNKTTRESTEPKILLNRTHYMIFN